MKYQKLSKTFRSITTASVALILIASLLTVSLGSITTHAASREPVRARHGIVASTNEVASNVGVDIMRSGGNAVDAAIATAFALAVTHPAAGNLGGGGFLVAFKAETKQVVTIDFRETAPLASTPRIYLGANGKPLPGHRAGSRAAGVPGTVRGLGLAHRRLGRA